MIHEAPLDLALAYAADLLDEPERQAVQTRLAAGDPRLVGEVAEARAVLARLSGTVPPVTPDPAVRRRLLDGLPARNDRQALGAGRPLAHAPRLAVGSNQGAPAAATPDGNAALVPRPNTGSGPQDVGRASSSSIGRAGGRPAWLGLAMAAAVGGLLVGGAAAYYAWDAKARASAASAEVAELKGRLVEQAGRAQDLRRVLGSADVKLATMSDPSAADPKRPRGRLLWDVDGRRWYVTLFDLAPLPAGKAYQLWFLPGGDRPPIPAPTFKVDAAGKASVVLDLPAGLTTANVAVSEEPEGGSLRPTVVRLVATCESPGGAGTGVTA